MSTGTTDRHVSRVDRVDASTAGAVEALIERSAVHERHSVVGEHKYVRLVEGEADTFGLLAEDGGTLVGYAQATCFPAQGALPPRVAAELVVDREHRRRGIGRALVERLVAEARAAGVARLDVWAHHADAAAAGLAAATGMRPSRRLWQLALDLASVSPDQRVADEDGDATIRCYRERVDDTALVALIRGAFVDHPENAGFDRADLEARRSMPWFDPSAILLAEDRHSGSLLGVHWMKLEPDRSAGEVYLLAVAPEAQGRGLGRVLLLAGLEEMRHRRLALAYLYVDATNEPAIALYRDAGFRPEHLDTCYSLDVASGSRWSDGAAAGHQLVDQHDRGDHQQQMDEPARDVDQQAEQPEHEQDDEDRPEHRSTS